VPRFSTSQVDGAIARLPQQSNASIAQVLSNARKSHIEALVHACEDELRTRGALNLSTAEAGRAAAISARTTGKALTDVIQIAFTEVTPTPEERLILSWIASHPGTSHVQTTAAYGRKDLSLVIGHLVYQRFGYFKPFLNGPIQSDLLLQRDTSTGRVCYTLRPETVAALGALGIL
jgi:hypothetical protein